MQNVFKSYYGSMQIIISCKAKWLADLLSVFQLKHTNDQIFTFNSTHCFGVFGLHHGQIEYSTVAYKKQQRVYLFPYKLITFTRVQRLGRENLGTRSHLTKIFRPYVNAHWGEPQ